MIRRLLAFLGILLARPDRPAWPPPPRRPEPPDPSPAQLAELQGLCSWWLVMRLVFRCRAAELAVPIP